MGKKTVLFRVASTFPTMDTDQGWTFTQEVMNHIDLNSSVKGKTLPKCSSSCSYHRHMLYLKTLNCLGFSEQFYFRKRNKWTLMMICLNKLKIYVLLAQTNAKGWPELLI